MVHSHSNSRWLTRPATFCWIAVAVLLGVLQLASIGCNGQMEPVKASLQLHWDQATAIKETDQDIANVIAQFDKEKGTRAKVLRAFRETRVKDVGIRKLAIWGHTLARLYEIPNSGQRDKLFVRMQGVAESLLSVRQERFSYIENARMRGWPMFVGEDDKKVSFEGFNFGNIGMAIAMTARITAERGEHQEAYEMLVPVLEALYDGFLTPDKSKTKLDSNMRVVYVPQDAPQARKLRHLSVAEQEECLGAPQAFNHGLLVARASIQVLRAMDAIDWKIARWSMSEWSMLQCRQQLSKLVRLNAAWLRRNMRQDVTGKDVRDKYPGKDGVQFFFWKYRELSQCQSKKDTYQDRPEDISHATYETGFVTEFREYVKDGIAGSTNKDAEIFTHHDVRSLVVTFLNRIVLDYTALAGDRFACDVTGRHEGSELDDADLAWKQCGGSRMKDVRPRSVPGWLPLATGVKDELRNGSGLKCDVLRMVRTVLPMTWPGPEFDEPNFGSMSSKWSAYAIEAKYKYYNFEAQIYGACSDMQPEPSTAQQMYQTPEIKYEEEHQEETHGWGKIKSNPWDRFADGGI